jgi:hypothetical protein
MTVTVKHFNSVSLAHAEVARVQMNRASGMQKLEYAHLFLETSFVALCELADRVAALEAKHEKEGE